MFLLDHTGFSEQNYAIFKEINLTVVDSLEEISVAVNDVSTKIMEIDTAITNIAEIGCFQNGILVATNLVNASQILSAKVASRKVLYLWDIDWMHSAFNYEWLYDTLSDENLEVIVRSESHRDALLNLCGKEPIGILQNFKLEQLWNLLDNTKTK
jgi:hypothetical protein